VTYALSSLVETILYTSYANFKVIALFSSVILRYSTKSLVTDFILLLNLLSFSALSFIVCKSVSNTSSKLNNYSFRSSIFLSFGSKLAFISCVRCVKTCLLLRKSLILNLYLYRSVALFFNFSITSWFSYSNNSICRALSSISLFLSFLSCRVIK